MSNKLNKKVLKYSTASLILALVFIALAFAINLVAGIITQKFNLYVDLTEEELYTISDESFELLSDMDEEVRIIFFKPLDSLDANRYLKNIKTLALEYEEKFDNVSVEYIDMNSNPELVRRFRKDYNLSSETIIVESGKRFTGFEMYECFVYADESYSSYAGFNGEYRFTSALLKVTRDTAPEVNFVINHREQVPTAFRALFEDSGFVVNTVDLLRDEIGENCEILIMVAPETDLTGVESEQSGVSEVTKLNTYLNNGGDMMVFVDPNTPELQNLDALLQTWGIGILHGATVQDNERYFPVANNMALFGDWVSSDETVSALHTAVSSKKTPVVSYYTSPISLVPLTNVNRGAGALLVSSPAAFVPKSAEENYIESVRVPLMAAGYNRKYNSNTGNTDVNYLVVGGSTYFVSDQFLEGYASTLANSEFVRNMVSVMTDEKMVLDIEYKMYNETTLVTDTVEERTRWLVALITVLPAAVLALGVAVFMKRRHQ